MFAQLISRINRSDSHNSADGASVRAVEAVSPLIAGLADGADALTAGQRDFLHLALDWVDAPLAFFDRALVLRFANTAYCALLGRERDALVGLPFGEVAVAGQGSDARGYAERAVAGENIEVDIAERLDGTLGAMARLEYRPQRDAGGAIVGVLAVLHRLGRRRSDQVDDAGEPRSPDGDSVSAPLHVALRIAQDDVVERERKQRELIESLPLPLVFIGHDALCKWANHPFCRAFDVAAREVGGMPLAAISPAFADASHDAFVRAAGGVAASSEQLLVLGAGAMAEGTARWYRAEFLPGFDRDDRQSGVYVLLTDIHESRSASLQLEQSEAHFRGFAEHVPETIVFLDREARFRYVNESFVVRSGIPRDRLIGLSVEEALGSAVRERFQESLDRAYAGESFTREGSDVFGDEFGTTREWREVRYLPCRDADGGVEGLYIVSRSLEDEKRAERAVRERDERIHFLTDNLPAQIAYFDTELKYRYCNQRFLSDYGLASVEEVIGRTAFEVVGSDVIGDDGRDAIDRALRGERASYERRVAAAPGGPRWLNVSLVADLAEDGTVRGLYSIAYDITDSKLAEGTRARQQEWIEAFIENFPQPLSYLDPAGVHQFSNRAYEDFVARKKNEIIGHTGSSVFGREIATVFKPSFRQALEGERLHTEHAVAVDAAATRYLAADWLPDVATDGNVRGVYFVIQDVSEAKQARHAYEESLREMQRAMDSVALPISFVDPDERLRFVNHTTTVWYGRSTEELIGMPMRDLMSDDDYRFAEPYIKAALGGEAVQYEREMRYHDGARRWVLIRYVSTHDENDVVTGFYTTATDIQSRKKQEIALQQANGLLTAHFENTPLASFTLDGDGRVTRWSSQAETLFGWQRHEVIERPFAELGLVDRDLLTDFLPDEDDPDTVTGNTRLHIVEARRRDGSTVTCEWHIAALRAAGRITSSLALIQDVSQRVEAERRLTEIAQRDTLTRLLNRNALEPTLRAFIERARQGNTGVAVLFLDLDHFKNINDTLGHRVGDLMLIEVASILRHCVRAEDEVARIGGDEFMVVIGHARPKAIAHETAQRILTALGTPIRVENQRLSVTSSIGIAVYPDHGRAPDALIRSADLAMYRAKENGKNRFEFFSALLAQRSERRSAVKGALKIALQRDALRLYFQPRVQISNGRIVGAEALLRWTDPRLGVVSPKEFIVIAEESGLIHELGLYVFRKACRQLVDWDERGVSLGVLSVNFSAHQLLVATFIDEVDRVIEETGVDPRCIEVEITETSMLFDLGVTRSVIADLKHRGMRIAIDDFGTGYSSLSHLQQLDVDTLKIDQSFIRDMLHDSGDAAITTAVISLARGLKLSTTAEGVENEMQLQALRSAGCDYYQGFLFSPAIVVEDIETLLTLQEREPATRQPPETDFPL